MNHTTDAASADLPPASEIGIGVIGGAGRLGGLLIRLFTGAGFKVEAADRVWGPVSDEFLARNRVIFVSVPIEVVEEVIRDIGPRLPADGLVVDVTSTKAVPVRAMLNHCPGSVIGCHPLFGPAVENLTDELVFSCPVRPGPWGEWFNRLWTSKGARVVDIEADEHDRLMGRVQVMRQMMIYTMERALINLDYRPERDLELSGPLFNRLIALIRRQRTQGADLFANIAIGNPYGVESFRAFIEAGQEILAAMESGSVERLMEVVGPKDQGL